MIYHVDLKYIEFKNYSLRIKVQFILFFNKFLNLIESRYWLTKLKLTDLVWMLGKIRHLIEFFKYLTIVYINHDVSFKKINKINLSISFIDKFNLQLIRILKYIQRFSLVVWHKSEKFLSCLMHYQDFSSRKLFYQACFH